MVRQTAVFFQYPYRNIENFHNIISCPAQYGGENNGIRQLVHFVEDKQKWSSPRLRNAFTLGNCHYSQKEAL
jgi:hypothetical protein